jgi:two-component system chemotaxis response regulator CheY
MAKNKILIVDDDEAIRKSLEEALVSEGFAVITANDGVVGLATALNEKPDLILTDLKMPVLDGVGMLEELRKSSDWGKKVPVIISTNLEIDEKTMLDIVKHEPSFYFLKSKINPSIIVDTIKEKLDSSISNELQ